MAKSKYAIPKPHNGIQYNTCKNPRCKHFGVHPEDEPKAYSYTYGGKQFPLLKCNSCGETPPMKSNQGIYEEVQRLLAHTAVVDLKCTNTACGNHTVPVGTPKAYRSFGKTPQGAQRYRCNECGKTISQPKATQYQHDTHRNVRCSVDDWYKDKTKDWFRPCYISFCIWLEDGYRQKLGLPSIIQGEQADMKAIMYSTWMNRAEEGHKELRLVWEKSWQDIFHAPSQFDGVEV